VSGKPTVVQMTELKHPNGQSPAVSSLHAGKTMAAIVPVVAAFDFRRLTMTMATIGIVAKVMLFIVVFTTPGETLVSELDVPPGTDARSPLSLAPLVGYPA
jgi:hypothetical protein